jgi:hypothetical protein
LGFGEFDGYIKLHLVQPQILAVVFKIFVREIKVELYQFIKGFPGEFDIFGFSPFENGPVGIPRNFSMIPLGFKIFICMRHNYSFALIVIPEKLKSKGVGKSPVCGRFGFPTG